MDRSAVADRAVHRSRPRIADHKRPKLYGAAGARVVEDVKEFVAGINAYIDAAELDPNLMPAEYAALGKVPEEWKLTDIIAEASLDRRHLRKGRRRRSASALTAGGVRKAVRQGKGKGAWENFREAERPRSPDDHLGELPVRDGQAVLEAGPCDAGPRIGRIRRRRRSVNRRTPAEAEGGHGRELVRERLAALTDTPDPQPIPDGRSIGSELMHNFFDRLGTRLQLGARQQTHLDRSAIRLR